MLRERKRRIPNQKGAFLFVIPDLIRNLDSCLRRNDITTEARNNKAIKMSEMYIVGDR